MTAPVDIVFTWCDSADAVWTANRNAQARKWGLAADAEANAACRFAGNDEIRFALRSVERFLPWVRQVVLVVADDNAPPPWLNQTNPRLRVVRHGEFIPQGALPTYSADTIEHHIARVPGLAEHFIFANDDTMFYRPTSPDFFFARDGYPVFRFGSIKPALAEKEKSTYRRTIDRAEALVRADVPEPCPDAAAALPRTSHHCIDAYRKSDVLACYARYRQVLEPTFANPFRTDAAINRILYAYDALAHGHGHFRLARFRILERRAWYKRLLRPGYADSICFVRERWTSGPDELRKWRPFCFCFNDTIGTTDEDRRWLQSFYRELFPEPSSFEREGMVQ